MADYQFHHIHHEAADVDAAVKFYQDNFNAILEERTINDGSPWARVRIGSQLMMISARTKTEVGLERYRGLDHFALTTSDFDETVSALKERGVQFFVEPFSPEPGVQLAFVSGPDNVKIEILSAK